MEQPGTTMAILIAIQGEYYKYLAEMMPNGRL
jgi:hypothetical protein